MLNLIEQKIFTIIEEFANYLDLTEEQLEVYDYLLELLMAINNETDSSVANAMRKDLYLYLAKHAKEFE